MYLKKKRIFQGKTFRKHKQKKGNIKAAEKLEFEILHDTFILYTPFYMNKQCYIWYYNVC